MSLCITCSKNCCRVKCEKLFSWLLAAPWYVHLNVPTVRFFPTCTWLFYPSNPISRVSLYSLTMKIYDETWMICEKQMVDLWYFFFAYEHIVFAQSIRWKDQKVKVCVTNFLPLLQSLTEIVERWMAKILTAFVNAMIIQLSSSSKKHPPFHLKNWLVRDFFFSFFFCCLSPQFAKESPQSKQQHETYKCMLQTVTINVSVRVIIHNQYY